VIAITLILMAETEETIEAQPKGEDNEDKDKDKPKGEEVLKGEPKGEPKVEDKEEDVLKLGNTFRRACMLNWFELVSCTGHFVVSLSLICKYANSNLPIDQFLLYNIFVPFFVLAVIDIFCTFYYVFALTQNTVRHLYVAVFHINIFQQLVGMLTSIYYLMVFYSPYHIYNLLVLTSSLGSPNHTITLQHLPDIFMIDLSVVFVLFAIYYALFLILTCSIYFKADKLRTFLSKYWFLRTILVLVLDLFLVHYYIYLLLLQYDQAILGHVLFFLAKTILVVWYLKIQICLPNSFKLKPLDGQKVPPGITKLKQAARIMEMKAEVKEVADSCGRSLSSPAFGVFAGHI